MTVGKQQQGDLPDTNAGLRKKEIGEEAQAERHIARRLYRLSLWLPLLLVFAPVVIPFTLFTGYRSRYAFVRWHSAQWALLTLAAVCVGAVGWGSDLTVSLIALGGWYVGNYISSRQVNRGECWLWQWWDDKADLPRPWALTPDAAPAPATSTLSTTPARALPSLGRAAPGSTIPAEAQDALARGQSLVQQGRGNEAAACFLAVFRLGPPELRRRAIAELEKLSEVETF